jgi:hypothetical protein
MKRWILKGYLKRMDKKQMGREENRGEIQKVGSGGGERKGNSTKHQW